eukprot:TRINITY_DN57624_c0_g1_i1.p1 TRINITY_DN57624_c0_g1~~TRINITY_DN57624_c0_g1_i1.p1  ORF type:complete len:560 (-),score=84.64 TRINITY_DN57624_c0_g1_i1:109-1788(-)
MPSRERSTERRRSPARGRYSSADRSSVTSLQHVASSAYAEQLAIGAHYVCKPLFVVLLVYFGVQIFLRCQNILLPFGVAFLVVTVLDPVKRVIFSALFATVVLITWHVPFLTCCLQRRGIAKSPQGQNDKARPRLNSVDLNAPVQRILLLMSVLMTVALAGRVGWMLGQVVWRSGKILLSDMDFFTEGAQLRQIQLQDLIQRIAEASGTRISAKNSMGYSVEAVKKVASEITAHLAYLAQHITLTVIFVLFWLFSPVQRDFSSAVSGAFDSVESYLKLKTLISLLVGMTNGFMLALIGIEVPAAWGLLTFMANFIPSVGGFLMSILVCIITLLDSRKTLSQVIISFLVQIFIHFSVFHIVEPIIFGSTQDIHSVVLITGLSFLGYISGLTGMFLSVPVLFALHAWLESVVSDVNYSLEARDDARTIIGLLEGRWMQDLTVASVEGEDGGISVLTGQIELEGEATTPRDKTRKSTLPTRSSEHLLGERGGTVTGTSLASRIRAMCPLSCYKTVRDFCSLTDAESEVRFIGLALRWFFIIGTFCFLFKAGDAFDQTHLLRR